MKKLILFLILFFSLCAQAQEKPLSFAEVIQAEGKSKEAIFSALREWVATRYISGKAVTQMEDTTTGTIILKADYPFEKNGFTKAYDGYVHYMLKLQAKDGRFRAEMSSISHDNKPGLAPDCSLGLLTTAEKSNKGGINKSFHNKIWKELKAKSFLKFNEIVASLKQINSFSETSEEDW